MKFFMIIFGNILSAITALIVGIFVSFTFLGTTFWDDPHAEYPFPVGGMFVFSILFLVFAVISIVYSHKRHSWVWAYTPVGIIVGLLIIGNILYAFLK